MIGPTLGIYIAWRFAKTLAAMLVSLLAVIIMVEFVEQIRKAAEATDVSLWTLLWLSTLKAPILMDKVFPFAGLFAAMLTLTQLNQKMELVVARSAGISAWQFLMPISFAAIIVGLFAAFVYNPVAVNSLEASKNLEALIYQRAERKPAADRAGYWIKQEDGSGTAIINARISRQFGTKLDGVKVLRFDEDGKLRERLDADTAEFETGGWQLRNVVQTNRSALPVQMTEYRLATELTREIIDGATALPESVPFWRLRAAAHKASLAGNNPDPFRVQWHGLLSLPFFLVAMVLIAATVSLRFIRFGQVGRLVLGGIVSGFLLYAFTQLVTSLGSNGIVPPAIAAWSPSMVAILFGFGILLHQEDG
jgi:lipopolysaccharide export system permease protein